MFVRTKNRATTPASNIIPNVSLYIEFSVEKPTTCIKQKTVNEASKDDVFTLLHHNNRLNKMKFTKSSIGENSNIRVIFL